MQIENKNEQLRLIRRGRDDFTRHEPRERLRRVYLKDFTPSSVDGLLGGGVRACVLCVSAPERAAAAPTTVTAAAAVATQRYHHGSHTVIMSGGAVQDGETVCTKRFPENDDGRTQKNEREG